MSNVDASEKAPLATPRATNYSVLLVLVTIDWSTYPARIRTSQPPSVYVTSTRVWIAYRCLSLLNESNLNWKICKQTSKNQ